MEPEKSDVLEHIGLALILAQLAESQIRFCLTYVLQKDDPLTLEMLERQNEAERRKTLGNLLNELRSRADLDDGFDELLRQFLSERNILVHNLDEVPGWSLQNVEGRQNACAFLVGFMRKAAEVQKVFMGLVMAWQEEIGMAVPVLAEHELITEIEAKYKSRVDEFFFEKAPKQKSE